MVQAGQHSRPGCKTRNEDCCGMRLAEASDLKYKGIVAITADGVGSSEAGAEASEYCVQGFISDYYSTPMSWSVQTSAKRIIQSLNSWLYAQGQRRYASKLSLASTLAVLILKSTTAYMFHVGDSRIYLIRKGKIKQLSKDHRLIVDRNKTYLARAMGGEHNVQHDFSSLALEVGDTFVLSSDGVHEFLDDERLKNLALQDDCEAAARNIVEAALQAGSDDNATCQVLRIEQLPNQDEQEFYRQLTALPFPPPLSSGMMLDHYRVIRELHSSVTIQIYLAQDTCNHETVVLKTPSVHFEDDPAYIDRFMHEEWVGRRINNPHVFKVYPLEETRSCLYYVTEFLEGAPLSQWILDHPDPDLSEVRRITEQIIKGLRGFHRKEMIHQDIKPDNIMIDPHGDVKIIDFGCVQVSGLQEVYTPIEDNRVSGTANYIAPELFDGFEATPKSDLYSLAVTVYEMLSHGHYPYGEHTEAKKAAHYDYISVRTYNPDIPIWLDGALQKATHPNPEKRYALMSEFLNDLHKPNAALMQNHTPLLERNPIGFWRGLAALLFALNLLLLYWIKTLS